MDSAIELRHLRYFASVAETENFTRAAERLGVSQPSVSQQIKDLEELLGTPLFARLGKRVRLTEAGEAFARHADLVLKKLDQAREAVEQIRSLERAHLEIGVIPAVHLAWVPPVLGILAVEHPGISVTVHEAPSMLIETEVESGRYDLGLGLLTRSSPNLEYERLLTQDFSLIVPARHPLAENAQLSLAKLAEVQLVVLPPRFPMRQEVEDLLETARLRPRVAHEVETIDGALATVRATGTATLLPAIVLSGRPAQGLVAVPLSSARPMEFGLIQPKGTEITPPAAAFITALRRHIKQSS
jgi:LysR family transcriptional regulator, cyn operon transcriptional activator